MVDLDDIVEDSRKRLSDELREGLWRRGVSEAQIDEYRLGYTSDPLPLKGRPVRDAYVFPLSDVSGNVRGIQVRGASRKDYCDYYPGMSVPFGLSQAAPHMWRSGVAWIVEGVYDLFPIQRTHPYVVAGLTANASGYLVRWLRRLVNVVYLAFDMDKTGRESARKFTEAHGEIFDVRRVDFPRVRLVNGDYSKDPNDLWSAWGNDRMAEYLRGVHEPR